MRWQKTSGLANQSSPTLTTPNIKNYHQIIFFAFVLERTPLYAKENEAVDKTIHIKLGLNTQF